MIFASRSQGVYCVVFLLQLFFQLFFQQSCQSSNRIGFEQRSQQIPSLKKLIAGKSYEIKISGNKAVTQDLDLLDIDKSKLEIKYEATYEVNGEKFKDTEGLNQALNYEKKDEKEIDVLNFEGLEKFSSCPQAIGLTADTSAKLKTKKYAICSYSYLMADTNVRFHQDFIFGTSNPLKWVSLAESVYKTLPKRKIQPIKDGGNKLGEYYVWDGAFISATEVAIALRYSGLVHFLGPKKRPDIKFREEDFNFSVKKGNSTDPIPKHIGLKYTAADGANPEKLSLYYKNSSDSKDSVYYYRENILIPEVTVKIESKKAAKDGDVDTVTLTNESGKEVTVFLNVGYMPI